MTFKRALCVAAAVVCLSGPALRVAAQTSDTFAVRLSPAARDAALRATIAGKGAATAVLDGATLTIHGSFESLPSPATGAQLHRGALTGVRGPAVHELTAARSTSGTIMGSIALSREQVQSLRKGQLYIQIDSEAAPDGTLWGWLLAPAGNGK